MKKLLRQAIYATAATVLTLSAASAQTFPNHSIEWVVPYAAGGGTDVVARTLGQPFSAALGQPVVIVNKPGAATNIGADYLARSKPEGYVVMTADTGTLAANPNLYQNLPFNAETDLVSVGLTVRFPMILVTRPSFEANNLKEFISWAKQQPNPVSYGTPGSGSPHHLATELFGEVAALSLSHIPYKGAAPAVQDVLGGQIPFMFVDSATGFPFISAGKLKAIAVASPQRLKNFPDVPTMDEQGLKGFEAYAWQGLVVSKGTPADIINTLNKALQVALSNPEAQARLLAMGLEITPSTPEQMTAFVTAERKKWGAVIKASGIKVD
jgi:tripartite-type tricarboxylate transporter receptor subunit TctC